MTKEKAIEILKDLLDALKIAIKTLEKESTVGYYLDKNGDVIEVRSWDDLLKHKKECEE